jgi:hypothetical protein
MGKYVFFGTLVLSNDRTVSSVRSCLSNDRKILSPAFVSSIEPIIFIHQGAIMSDHLHFEPNQIKSMFIECDHHTTQLNHHFSLRAIIANLHHHLHFDFRKCDHRTSCLLTKARLSPNITHLKV